MRPSSNSSYRRATWAVFAASIAVAVAFAGWSASAAVSLRPYVPRPVDFELGGAPATVGAVASARRLTLLRSRAIEAPKRFNLVGLRWRGARSALTDADGGIR